MHANAGCQDGYGEAFTGTCKLCPNIALNTLFYILSYGLTILLLLVTIKTQLGKGLELQGAGERA